MAKLSARGRVEYARVEKVHLDGDGGSSRDTRVLMSDGAILTKTKFRRADGSSWSTGWTVLAKLKVATVDALVARRWVVKKAELGFLEVCTAPYRYSPTVEILTYRGRPVVWFETRHKTYEVFAVPAELLRFKTIDEAEAWHIRFARRGAYHDAQLVAGARS